MLQVTTADGTSAVLKVGFPHFEGVWEAVGLERWGPDLAPEVLRQDPWTWSLLLEQLRPGTQLVNARSRSTTRSVQQRSSTASSRRARCPRAS